MPNIEIERHPAPLPAEERQRILEKPGFGTAFSDHMITMEYRQGGWGPTRLRPFSPISLSPAAMVLHYGQAVFEGFKAYRQPDGGIATFRPAANARRMNLSAQRLAMPALEEARFVEAADALIRADAEWVPSVADSSLYMRPLMIATEAALGVRSAAEYLFVLFASPAGSYFASGLKPVSVWVSTDYVRAAQGGTGIAKCAGNYAATLVPQTAAAQKGCSQVLYLDARERRYVEEMGGMNVFFVVETQGKTVLLTPELERGTLLAGVTRDSIMRLARDAGHQVEERLVTLDEVLAAHKEGRLREAFACGTAAVITAIGRLVSDDFDCTIGEGAFGPIAGSLRQRLVDIQYGRAADPYGWMHRVP